jgi:hypothetical protein
MSRNSIRVLIWPCFIKKYSLLFILTLTFSAISLSMCSNVNYNDDHVVSAADDDNNDTNNTDDDDNNDNDTDEDDDTGTGPDFWEMPDCKGYDLPSCDTEIDVPPQLFSVAFLVSGKVVTQPLTIKPTDTLTFSIEFEYPNYQLCGGHIFIVKGEESLCLDRTEGTISDKNFPMGLPSICSTVAYYGEPFTFPVDPLIFLNGEGAPYYLEISNDCATHSNRLPLDIVTDSGGDSSNDDDDSSGHFSCS